MAAPSKYSVSQTPWKLGVSWWLNSGQQERGAELWGSFQPCSLKESWQMALVLHLVLLSILLPADNVMAGATANTWDHEDQGYSLGRHGGENLDA